MTASTRSHYQTNRILPIDTSYTLDSFRSEAGKIEKWKNKWRNVCRENSKREKVVAPKEVRFTGFGRLNLGPSVWPNFYFLLSLVTLVTIKVLHKQNSKTLFPLLKKSCGLQLICDEYYFNIQLHASIQLACVIRRWVVKAVFSKLNLQIFSA